MWVLLFRLDIRICLIDVYTLQRKIQRIRDCDNCRHCNTYAASGDNILSTSDVPPAIAQRCCDISSGLQSREPQDLLEYVSNCERRASFRRQRELSGTLFHVAAGSVVHVLRLLQFGLHLFAPIVLPKGLHHRVPSSHLRCSDSLRLRCVCEDAPSVGGENQENNSAECARRALM